MFEAINSGKHKAKDDVRRLEHVVHSILVATELHRLQRVYQRDHKQQLHTYHLIRALKAELGADPNEVLPESYGVPDPPDVTDVWLRPAYEDDDEGQRTRLVWGLAERGDVGDRPMSGLD